MCSGTMQLSYGRVVYGQTEKALKAQTGRTEDNPTLDLRATGSARPASARPRSPGRCSKDEAAALQAVPARRRGV